jgi:hypothetical protein
LVDLNEIVARLYTVPPEQFIAERTETVDRVRKTGDTQLAATLAKLRRPTVAAWLVNLLAHQRPDLVADLLALGEELRSAQRELRGADLRELSAKRRATVTALAREAHKLAVAAGRSAREKLPLLEVEQTLVAALADTELAEEVRSGILTKPLEYAGFGEAPRPQLRLLKGGRDERAPKQSLQKSMRGDADEDDGARDRQAVADAREAQKAREAEAARRAEEERKAAERQRAVEYARAMKAAHRDLLAANAKLADAKSAREAALQALGRAETAEAAAQEKADKAQAVVDDLAASAPD